MRNMGRASDATCASCVAVTMLCDPTQTVMNTTRTVFGRHRSGAVFPMLLCVKPMASSFAGVMQKLITTDQYVLHCAQHCQQLCTPISMDTQRVTHKFDPSAHP
jgi:hypothetical protein